MARITLHIEAESLVDLADTISGLRYPSAFTTDISSDRPGANIHGQGPDEPKGLNPHYVDPGAESGEPQRRSRRTKAQIAVDEAIAQGEGGASGVSGSANSPSKDTALSGEPGESSPPTSNASPASLAEVRNAMAAHLDREGKSAATAMVVLGEFKTETGDAVKRATELQAKDYAAAIEKLSA